MMLIQKFKHSFNVGLSNLVGWPGGQRCERRSKLVEMT